MLCLIFFLSLVGISVLSVLDIASPSFYRSPVYIAVFATFMVACYHAFNDVKGLIMAEKVKKEQRIEWIRAGVLPVEVRHVMPASGPGRDIMAQVLIEYGGRDFLRLVSVPPDTKVGAKLKLPMMVGVAGFFVEKPR